MVQDLALGESIVETYTVTVTDDNGTDSLSDTQDVLVTIQGTNDEPIISVETGDSTSGSVTEADSTAALTDSFSSLGLSPDMVGKYTDIILDYVQSEGGQQAMTLLKNALL